MAVVYTDYSKDRIGWFFGLTGVQLGMLAVTLLPVFWAMNAQRWPLVGTLALVWAVVAVLVVVPVRGRSATGWLAASLAFAVGALAGWTVFRSKAATGQAADLGSADLPGVLAGVTIHDGPPYGALLRRVAILQDKAARTWAVTAAVTHPGIGLADTAERRRHGAGLGDLLDVCARTELIDEILLMVRTVPEDGAERALWIQRHRRPTSPTLSRQVNDDLAAHLSRASVRTEAFVTLVVPEARLGREARQSGGGLDGRARVLFGLMSRVPAVAGQGAPPPTNRLLQRTASPQPLLQPCATPIRPTQYCPRTHATTLQVVNPPKHGHSASHGSPAGHQPSVNGEACGKSARPK